MKSTTQERLKAVNNAYIGLKSAVMLDRYSDGNLRKNFKEFDDAPILKAADCLCEQISEMRNHQQLAEITLAASDYVLLNKAKAFLIDAYELVGISNREFANELVECEVQWLNEANEHLKSSSEESVGLALSLLWLCLQAGEERYRRREYEGALNSIKNLWKLIKEGFSSDDRWHTPIMLALTEETILQKDIRSSLIYSDRLHSGTLASGNLNKDPYEAMARNAPKYTEDLLSLLGRLGLVEGKIAIRLLRFSLADRSLEQCLRSTSAWRQLKLRRLELAGDAKSTEQIIPTKNFAGFKTAVAQCYLSFGYLRRGRFRRAITQIIPAKFTLERSNWVLSNIFADMIRAGAERRLAGIHNEEHVLEVIELAEKTKVYFDQDKTMEDPSIERLDSNIRRDFVFLLRAYYEIGVASYYRAEMGVTKSTYCPAEIQGNMDANLREAERYSDLIINYIENEKPPNEAFWLANANHLKAFVAMKRPISKIDTSKGEFAQADNVEFERAEKDATKCIEAAVEYAKLSLGQGKWLMTETLTDYAHILNQFAKYCEMRAEKKRRGKPDPPSDSTASTNPDRDEWISSQQRSTELSEQELISRKRALARRALKQLEDAFKVAMEMALEESLSEPRHNFSGPIYLYQAESYALLGDKPNAEIAYKQWELRRNDVEFSRVILLSDEVYERVKAIDQTLVFDGERDELNFNKQSDRLRSWLLTQAIERGGSDAEAINLLGISRATYYAWKKDHLRKTD